MGQRPLYQGHDSGIPHDQGHAGLLFFRYFDGYSKDWKVEVTKTKNPKLDFIRRFAARPKGDSNQLSVVLGRRKALVEALQGDQKTLHLSGSFVTGLGLEHPVENGFLWHPTLATPYIPGSTLKGLLRNWMETWVGVEKGTLDTWFGAGSERQEKSTTLGNDDRQGGNAGSIIFFDAVPVQPVALATDVMTPHMGKWYEQGHQIKDTRRDHEKIPADWHDPVPVPFLVVRDASFHFMIAARTPAHRQAVTEIMEHLETALATVGIGAKTAVGYGRFSATSGSTAAPTGQEADLTATPKPDPEAMARVDARNEEAERYPKAIEPWIRMAHEPDGRDRLLQKADEWLSILENMEPLHRPSLEFFEEWLNKNVDGLIESPDKKKGGKSKKRKPRQIAIARRLIALLEKTAS